MSDDKGNGAAVELDPERQRLKEANEKQRRWRRWGPYLSEREWGTVREDYSANGDAWDYFPHDHARSRTYRWQEDGLLGISDEAGLLCFSLALWNEADPILKERLFGLTGPEGNHGEDVKEYYFYLDSTPTHSYMKALYRYPQRAFPYTELVVENRRRGRDQPEYELIDTGVLAEDRYFDVVVEYAKAAPEDVVIRITAFNHGPDPAPLHILPTLCFRNTWDWGVDDRRPGMQSVPAGLSNDFLLVQANHFSMGDYWLACADCPRLLFTENESNAERLWGRPNRTPFVKDGIDEAIVHRNASAVNMGGSGTKAAAHYTWTIAPGTSAQALLRLSTDRVEHPFADAEAILSIRQAEADRFYQGCIPATMPDDARDVQRQALSGLLWSKQFYHYGVKEWLDGDPAGPPPPAGHQSGRNCRWFHVDCHEVLLMPDNWEYPWFAAWDLAFHCVPMAIIDPEYAKQQLILLLREWYMHPNGQLPAYEWSFGDVNPPVHAWAALRVYEIERQSTGKADPEFLQRVFHKLLLNFTWWVNREDSDGRNVFQGGFLGLDNIGVFDRSAPLPVPGHLEQSDGTAWMGMFCLNMLAIALELAQTEPAYKDVASKFFEHFLYIAAALNNIGETGIALWDENDEFFYDVLHFSNGEMEPLRLRSLVGLIPLFAVQTIEPGFIDNLPEFRARMQWFLDNRTDLTGLVSRWNEPGEGERQLLALVRGHRMKRLLRRMLDPDEFLSDHGVRSLSRVHREHPYIVQLGGMNHVVSYEPAESRTSLFGGNSNWRGPVWFPINFLLIEALQRFHHYYGDDFLVEHPTGSGNMLTLEQIADDLSRRLTQLFLRGQDGRRAVFGANELFQTDPRWRDYIPFHEYFHGDTGAGLGASHQTGWTALVATLLAQTGGR